MSYLNAEEFRATKALTQLRDLLNDAGRDPSDVIYAIELIRKQAEKIHRLENARVIQALEEKDTDDGC
jgi:hypothetical protein